MTRGRFRTKPDIYRTVKFHHDSLPVITDTPIGRIGPQHRAALIVVDCKLPEVLHRDIRRQVQLEYLATIRGLAPGVGHCSRVLRAFVDQFERHRRRDVGGIAAKMDHGIGVAHVRLGLELIVAADEAREPGAIRIVVCLHVRVLEDQGTGGGITDCDSFCEDLLDPLVGIEALAILDADHRQLAEDYRAECLVWLVLDNLVDVLVELVGICTDGVENLA